MISARILSSLARLTFRMPFYAVKIGKKPGVYGTWSECQSQIIKFSGAKFKKFSTAAEAWTFVNGDEGSNDATTTNDSRDSQSNQISAQSKMKTLNETTACNNTANVILSPTKLQSFKLTLVKLKRTMVQMQQYVSEAGNSTMAQLQQYMTQAEEQFKMIQCDNRGIKRAISSDATDPTRGLQSGYNSAAKRKRTEAGPSSNNSNLPDTRTPVSVYTDGCCHGNQNKTNRRAGIGVFWGPDHPMNVSEPLTGPPTNNRAEIQAACKAIQQAIDCGISDLVIHTDSDYVIKCMTQYIHKWRKNGWKSSTGDDVKNQEDLMQLSSLLNQSVNVKWVHVRGHQGIEGNEEADRLANEGAIKGRKH